MELVDKDALVAEIKRRISLFKKEKKTKKWSAEALQMNVVILSARIVMLEEILSFIDTLEVKEVDLKKEIKEYLSIYWSNEKDLHPFLGHVAKHFFALGMAVSSKAQKGE